MARPSKLSERQWADVERRLLKGEIPAALAKEYGVDRAALTRKFSQQLRNVKDVANQIVKTEYAINALPVAQQIQAFNLADEIKGMNREMAIAGNCLAVTNRMFAKAAMDATTKIMFKSMSDDGETVDPARLAECTDEIAAVMKSTLVANESGKQPLKLMEIAAKTEKVEDAPLRVIGGLPDKIYD